MSAVNQDHASSEPTNLGPHKPATKPRSLKSSCDFCSVAKVRCDRGKPQCSRCINNEVDCNYSQSCRFGKVRQKYAAFGASMSNTTGILQKSQQQEREESMTGSQKVPALQKSFFDASAPLNQSIPTNSYDPDNMDILNTSDFMSDTWKFGSISNNSHDSTGLQHGALSWSNLEFLNPESPKILHNFSQQMNSELSDMDLQLQLRSASRGQIEDQNHQSSSTGTLDMGDCMRRAFVTLENLHTSVDFCSLSSCDSGSYNRSGNRDLDATLEVNRKAMNNVVQILSCACARGWNVSYLLILIMHQVLESHLSLLKSHLSTPSTPTGASIYDDDSSTSSSQRAPSINSEVPMAIGGYILNGPARTKVLMQVLRSEIEDMGGLIDRLVSQYTLDVSSEITDGPRKVFIEALQRRREKALQSAA